MSGSLGTQVRSDPTVVLDGAVAVVTGGGGGLGAAVAGELASAGATVVVADIRAEAAERVAGTLDGGRGRSIELDVADDLSVASAIEGVLEDLGRVDVLVNNAGVDRTAPFAELDARDWDRIMGVNLHGPVRMTRAVWPTMAAAGRGAVVNIVSTAARRAWANASAYHASKWGLLGLSHALHVEGRPLGISVSAVIAGGMRTPFLFDRFPDLDPGVLQEPENVARVVRFVIEAPAGSVIPEVLVLPTLESSWP
jgi:NAD(P)-dependent dehydrogenase (short-subunit alcohol dehydrogenase family)